MKCPHCGGIKNTVLNTDRKPGSDVVVRRRLCVECRQVYKGIKRDGMPEFVDQRKAVKALIKNRDRMAPERRAPEHGKWGIRSTAAPELVAFLKKEASL